MENNEKLYFASDYMEGAHPEVLERLVATNMEHTPGYGTDDYCAAAREKILKACNLPEGEVHFMVGGTQTNSIVIGSVLRPYQGVMAADTGHINCHESGAIERTGHKVIALKHHNGKLSAKDVRQYLIDFYADDNWEHMVVPGMVYISHPTEYGTLYDKKELSELSEVCKEYNIPLYMDGARLAYALASGENDLGLQEIAQYCDIFYVGGTKCGALFGEAVVIRQKGSIPHFFSMIKQGGGLLAKGRLLGVQFEALFEEGLYYRLGETAIETAGRIRECLKKYNYELFMENPTNQVFCIMDNKSLNKLGQKVVYSFWEKIDEEHTAIRLCTGWATKREDVDALLELLKDRDS